MKKYFTVTNYLDNMQSINLDYMIGFQEVKEGDEQFVTVTMVHPTDQTTAYDVRVKEDYNEVATRFRQAQCYDFAK